MELEWMILILWVIIICYYYWSALYNSNINIRISVFIIFSEIIVNIANYYSKQLINDELINWHYSETVKIIISA